MDWTKLADDKTIEKTAEALKQRGFEVTIVENGAEAKKKALELIPKKAQVMEMTSITLQEIGISKEIDESGEYDSIRKKIIAITDEKERNEFRKHVLAPAYAIGSVQAITEDGQLLMASASGSQLPAYVYGATNVIWVAGTQKIVKNVDEGIKRIYEQALPNESERVKKVYGMPHSSVNKIVIYERDKPGRINIILVKEKLGF
jgi:LUD domain